MERYYTRPGPAGTNSFSVIDREKERDTEVIVPLVTYRQAERCANCLNSGREPWSWLRGIIERKTSA